MTYRFEYSLFPYSCEGELEFIRGTPFGSPASDEPELMGNLREPEALEGGSVGEVAVVDEPERG